MTGRFESRARSRAGQSDAVVDVLERDRHAVVRGSCRVGSRASVQLVVLQRHRSARRRRHRRRGSRRRPTGEHVVSPEADQHLPPGSGDEGVVSCRAVDDLVVLAEVTAGLEVRRRRGGAVGLVRRRVRTCPTRRTSSEGAATGSASARCLRRSSVSVSVSAPVVRVVRGWPRPPVSSRRARASAGRVVLERPASLADFAACRREDSEDEAGMMPGRTGAAFSSRQVWSGADETCSCAAEAGRVTARIADDQHPDDQRPGSARVRSYLMTVDLARVWSARRQAAGAPGG